MTNTDMINAQARHDEVLENYGTPFATLTDVSAGASVRITAGPFTLIQAKIKEVYGNTGFILLDVSVFGQRFDQVFHWKDVAKL
jgi:transcription antitermination factor NusG